MNHHCLNCDLESTGKFCPNCGQKTSTHRYSLEYFLLNDLVRNLIPIDKGFFYTIKELFTRPGHSIRAFVQGKRAKHFNYFTFILLVISMNHFAGSLSEVKLVDVTSYSMNSNEVVAKFEKMSRAYPQLFTLLQIPFLALFSYLFFRKSKQNLTENLVLNTYKTSAELLLSALFTMISVVYKNIAVLSHLYSVVAVLALSYSVWFYYQYFSVFGYSKVGLLIRSILTTVIITLVISAVSVFAIGVQDGFNDAK